MKSIKELKEQRADIHDKLQLITSTVKREGRNMTDSEKTEFRNLTDEFDEFTVEIRKAEKAEQRLHTGPAPARQDAFGQPLDQDKMTGARALAGWAKLAGGGIATDEERQALTDSGMQIKADGSLIMRFAPETLGRTGVEARALGTTATNIGGSTVPTSVMETLIKARLAVGPILDYVRTFRTDTGETMEVPTWSGTSERGELTSEAGEVSEDTSTPFGTKTLGAYKWDSKIIKISSELLEDSALDMASEIGREIGERLGRAETYYVTRGTGSDEPAGMRGAIAESSVSAISYDNLVDLYTAIDPAHLSSPNCAWTIHKAQIAAIRKLKDSNNQPLWQPAMSAGDPDRLFGYPVLFNPYMDSTAVGDTGNERPIIFGDFGRVFLREVRELRLHRLNERYIENDQVGFIAFMRFDSEVADPGENALKALRIEADGGS